MANNRIKVTSEMQARWKAERKLLKISQSEMDERLGYESEGKNYGRIERGEQSVNLKTVKEIAKILRCDYKYLLCDPQHPYKNEQHKLEKQRKEREELFAAYHQWDSEMEKLKAQKDFPWISANAKDSQRENMVITCNAYPVKELVEYIVKNGGYNQILDGLRVVSEYLV